VSTEDLRDKAHELIGQLDAGRLAAVVRLLEVLVHDDQENEEISVEEEAAVARSKEWFRENDGIPFEHVVADLGLAMDEIREAAGKDSAV
jgi:hypothetical protein